MNYFVYIYSSQDGTAYYVGEGEEGRCYATHTIPVPKSRDQIQVFPCSSKDDCVEIECDLIKFFGRRIDGGILMNLATGPGCTGVIKSEETLRKLSASLKKYYESEEACDAISKRQRAPVTLISPDGESFTVQNVSRFARENQLDEAMLRGVVSGKQKFYKDWHLPGAQYARESVSLVSPDGEIFTVRNVARLAKEQGVNPNSLRHVANGIRNSSHGWKLADDQSDKQ